jgi:hypothetical protein
VNQSFEENMTSKEFCKKLAEVINLRLDVQGYTGKVRDVAGLEILAGASGALMLASHEHAYEVLAMTATASLTGVSDYLNIVAGTPSSPSKTSEKKDELVPLTPVDGGK